MDWSSVAQFISNVGFPIACVCAMFYFWNKEREDHKAEMEKVTTALNNNTIAVTQLVEKLDKE